MIMLSDVFGMINNQDCADVATSLVCQGCVPEVSIPIYDIFFLKLHSVNDLHRLNLADSIMELNMLRSLSSSCGAVAASINLLDMDILTLIDILLTYTPNNGPHIFFKPKMIMSDMLDDSVLSALFDSTRGVLGLPDLVPKTAEFVEKIIDDMFNRLIEVMGDNCKRFGIYLHTWNELYDYFNMLRNTQEFFDMSALRRNMQSAIF